MSGISSTRTSWLIDLETGTERQLTNFGRDFAVRDFDVSLDGREIVLDRVQEYSDVVLLDSSPAALTQPEGYSSPILTKMGSLSIGAG